MPKRGPNFRTPKTAAWDSLWNECQFITGTGLGFEQHDAQLSLEDAIDEFHKTNPLVSQINAVEDIIKYAFRCGQIDHYRKPNQSLKDAALEYNAVFESPKQSTAEAPSAQGFDFEPVLKEMIELFRQRTKKPSIEYLEVNHRVSWTDVSACMKRHGYPEADFPLKARQDWFNNASQKMVHECRKILKEAGEDPSRLYLNQ